jgi:FkbM family methyltransferase
MIGLLGKITRNMPNIPYKHKFILLFKFLKSKKSIVIKDYQKNMKLDLDINFEMQSRLFWFGYHHLEENRFFSRLLKPEHVLLDIGANFGEFTILAAKYITRGRIFSFEPDPKTFCKLKRNCELNALTNVVLFDCALGEREEKVNLYTPTSQSHEGLMSLLPISNEKEDISSVIVRCLDNIKEIASHNRIDFVKIDVEGAELEVLKGGFNTFAKHTPMIIIEINEERFSKFGYCAKDLISFIGKIKQYNFFLFHLDGGLIPISERDLIGIVDNKQKECFNILCL